MADDPQLRSFLVAAGLVVAAVVLLVAFWKITQSLLKLCFWAAVLAVIALVCAGLGVLSMVLWGVLPLFIVWLIWRLVTGGAKEGEAL